MGLEGGEVWVVSVKSHCAYLLTKGKLSPSLGCGVLSDSLTLGPYREGLAAAQVGKKGVEIR